MDHAGLSLSKSDFDFNEQSIARHRQPCILRAWNRLPIASASSMELDKGYDSPVSETQPDCGQGLITTIVEVILVHSCERSIHPTNKCSPSITAFPLVLPFRHVAVRYANRICM